MKGQVTLLKAKPGSVSPQIASKLRFSSSVRSGDGHKRSCVAHSEKNFRVISYNPAYSIDEENCTSVCFRGCRTILNPMP